MDSYLPSIINVFKKNSDRSQAVPMKAYMKNKFEYLGIKSPLRNEISKPFLNRLNRPTTTDLWPIIHNLWNLPEREFQYFALALLEKYSRETEKNWIDEFEKIIIKKSWWDSIDGIASNQLGNYFKKYPDQIGSVTQKWMSSGNIWLQRCCILFQLKYKDQTDKDLLAGFIIPLAASKEFFIAKSIGWSLRQYSKFNPEWVKEFVKNNTLQPLSVREALRLMQ